MYENVYVPWPSDLAKTPTEIIEIIFAVFLLQKEREHFDRLAKLLFLIVLFVTAGE